MDEGRSAIDARPIECDTVADFRRLLTTPPHGWCWCVAWEAPTWEGWTARTEAENRALREELWARGEYHGYLLYVDGAPVAWSRVGPRAAWPKLCRSFDLDPSEEVHAFVCFGIVAEHRSRGLMHELMDRALEDLSRKGVRRVEGFPRKSDSRLEPGEAWMGPLRLFERAGFEAIRDLGHRSHMQKRLHPSGERTDL